jgi:hypothetical protein
MNLYQDHVILGNEATGTTTRASDLYVFDSSNDADIQFTASSTIGRLTVASGQTLYVASSSIFHLNLPTETHHFKTATSATVLASSNLSLTGDFTQQGTFTSPDPNTAAWTSRTSTANIEWSSVTYGNGLFVAVARNGIGDRVMTSPDGIEWTPRSAAADAWWRAITYGNGLFVAVNDSTTGNRIMTSTNGIDWDLQTTPGDKAWRAITYGNGLFVAVAAYETSNSVMTSPDGITWTFQESAPNYDWHAITYGNGLFVAVNYYGSEVMTSPDGVNWTLGTSAISSAWTSVTYGNGLFVAVAHDGTNRVMTSPDGITWTARSAAAATTWLSVTYGNGLFVAVACSQVGTSCASGSGTGNRVMTSPDGINWTLRTDAAANIWMSVTYGNGLFVAVSRSGTGNRVMTSAHIPYLSLVGTTTQTLSGTMTGSSTLPHVTASGAGTKTFLDNASTSDLTILNNSGTVTAPNVLGINGNFSNASSFTGGTALYLAGAYTNTATVTAPTSFILSGANDQRVTGGWNGAPNLTLTGTGVKTFITPATTTDVTTAAGTEFAPNSLTILGDYTADGSSTHVGAVWTERTAWMGGGQMNGATYGNGLFVAVGANGSVTNSSSDGITWTSRAAPAANIWTSVTYGNGLYVAVADSGTGNRVMISSNGIDWATSTSAADNDWQSVTYGNGLFVAVADTGIGNRVMTSPDGIEWTTRTSAADNNWRSVTYANGLFVAVANSGTGNRVMTSSNGIDWDIQTSAANNNWNSVTYGNGLFVAVASSGTGNRVMTSPDGITWTIRTSAADRAWGYVTYGDGLFVALSTAVTEGSDRIMTSPDGITWTIRNISYDIRMHSLVYGNGLFVAINRNTIFTSGPSSLTFASSSPQTISGNLTGESAFGNVILTGAGEKTFTSPASTTNFTIAATNTAVIAPTALTIRGNYDNQGTFTANNGSVTFATEAGEVKDLTGNLNTNPLSTSAFHDLTLTGEGSIRPLAPLEATGNFTITASTTFLASSTLAVGGDFTQNGTFTIPDPSASSWTSRTPAADNGWRSVTYGNGLFVAVAWSGTGNRVMTSPDGITWTSRTSAADNSWNSVTYGDGLFVAVSSSGTGNRVMTSPDGITWATSTTPADNNWNSVTYGNGLFVAVSSSGTGNRVMTSPDGITWATSTTPADNSWNSVTYGNGLFVAVAGSFLGARVMTSPDGITWTSRTSAANYGWQSVTYGNGLFVAVSESGTGNRVMTSPDGTTWTSRTSAADNYWLSVTYGNGLFVAVADSGTGNRVMTSPDGITWTSRTSAADNAWESVTYGNGLFVAVACGVSATFCNTTAGNRIMTSPEQQFLDLNGASGQTLSGSMAGSSTLPNILATGAGTKTFLDNASTSAFTVANTSGTITAPASLSITGVFRNESTFNSGATLTIDGNFNNLDTFTGGSTLHLTGAYSNTATVTAPTNLTLNGTNNQLVTGSWVGEPNLNLSGTGTKIFTTSATTTTVTTDSGTDFAPTSLTVLGDYTVSGSSTHAGAVWTTRSARSGAWRSVTYGNGLFVAVSSTGSGNRVMTSPDGITWTTRTSVADNWWSSVTYGNGLFVAVACGVNSSFCNSTAGTRVMTSPDGITWTARTAAADNEWRSVTYGNGLFVAVSDAWSGNINNRVMTSPDGITWTARTAAADDYWQSVTYGNGLFVAVSESGTGNRVMTSPDGTTWTSRTSASSNQWRSVTYGNGLFVAVSSSGTGNRVMTSPDGITWATSTTPADNNWNSVTYGNGLFVAVSSSGTGNRVMTSPDGITWTIRTGGADQQWYGVTYGNGLFVAVCHNSCVMTAPVSTLTFAGDTPQTISGNLTGPNAFGNVILTGAEHTFATSADFYTLTKEATGPATTTFEAGAQFTVTGTWTMSGTEASPHALRSTVADSYWYVDPQGERDLAHLDVKDSYNSNETTIPCYGSMRCYDSGNNVNWQFIFFASDRDQTFLFGQATSTLATVTIIEGMSAGTVRAAQDIRISIDTALTDFRFDTETTTLTFGGSAASKVSSTVTYENDGATLVINVTDDFGPSDTLYIDGVQVGSFASATAPSRLMLHLGGSTVGEPDAYDLYTIAIGEALFIEEHGLGQVPNQFIYLNSTDVPLMAFSLRPGNEDMLVSELVFNLSAVIGVTNENMADVRLYRDNNSDRGLDVGDTLIGTGTLAVVRRSGTLTFSDEISVSAGADYIVVANLHGSRYGTRITFALRESGVSALGVTSGMPPAVLGSVEAEHRFGREVIEGGTDDGGERFDGAAVPGAGIVTGGGSGGGTRPSVEDDGETIGSETGFEAPTGTNSPHNQWTNGSNAFASNNTYATADAAGALQSYSTFNFSIPGTDTIKGVVVKLEASASAPGGTIAVVLSWDGGVSTTTTMYATTALTGTDAVYVLGSEGDTWGHSWTPLHFSNDNFRVRVIAHPSGGNTVRIDAIQVRPYHQAEGGGGGSGGRF